MRVRRLTMRVAMLTAAVAALSPMARAAQRVTLKSGFSFDCARSVVDGGKVRLYLFGQTGRDDGDFLEVSAASVASVETIPDPPVTVIAAAPAKTENAILAAAAEVNPTVAELGEMLSKAGAEHHIDAELLASVVHAESGGRARAVSRTGARGLMQLMPGTAAELGVADAFAAGQNVEGGTKYLDALLTRYHDNLSLALAAYNAGPGAVDRYRGVPPFRETRAYVSRVIREFNRRKTALLAASR